MSTDPAAKILIVEDNETNLELFLEILEMDGYTCLSAREGHEALEIATRERPDLILLDIQLPGIDGISLMKLLRSRPETQSAKIIALTAHAMKGDREMFLQNRFDGYISKPVQVLAFLKSIREYLG